jgi:hypothetical protein
MKGQTRTFSRLTWGIALAILLIGLLVASPQVVEALKRLLGYVPGVGYVEQGASLRMLAAPVTLEKDGLILIIEKGAADSGRTVLLGHIEGYLPDRQNEGYCDTPVRLLLPVGPCWYDAIRNNDEKAATDRRPVLLCAVRSVYT